MELLDRFFCYLFCNVALVTVALVNALEPYESFVAITIAFPLMLPSSNATKHCILPTLRNGPAVRSAQSVLYVVRRIPYERCVKIKLPPPLSNNIKPPAVGPAESKVCHCRHGRGQHAAA